MPLTTHEAQISHYLGQARETVKILEHRALLLMLPVIVTTYAITNSAIPHFQKVEGTLARLTSQKTQTENLHDLEIKSLGDTYIPNVKRTESQKLTDEQKDRLHKREDSSFEQWKIRQEALKAIKRAPVDVPIPGSEKVKVSLYYACAALQGIIFVILFHLWGLRRRAIYHLNTVADKCGPLLLSKNCELAGPVSSLLLPLPCDEVVGTLLGAKETKAAQWLPLCALLLVSTVSSFWLQRINSRISDLIELDAPLDYLPFALGALFLGATLCLALGWVLLPPTATAQRAFNVKKRRLFLFTMLGLLFSTAIAIPRNSKIAFSFGRKFRQLIHRVYSRVPRYRKKRAALETKLVKDGFLFNPTSGRFHLVARDRVASIKWSPEQEKAFAKFIPIDGPSLRDNLCTIDKHSRRHQGPNKPSVSQIANGLTTIAIERAVIDMYPDTPLQALDLLRDSIVCRLPLSPPRNSSLLDLRLFDLYAKLCVVHFEDQQLKCFTELLNNANLGFLVADRMERWLDPKSKWRKRVLNFGRCSNVGYPVVGRCGFESRPTNISRSKLQWFHPRFTDD